MINIGWVQSNTGELFNTSCMKSMEFIRRDLVYPPSLKIKWNLNASHTIEIIYITEHELKRIRSLIDN